MNCAAPGRDIMLRFARAAMTIPFQAGPLATAAQGVLARAADLPAGEAERHVQTCARQLASACLRRSDVRPAVERLVAAVEMLQESLQHGGRRRAQHDVLPVERLLEAFQEELLPELRRQDLL